MFSSYLFGDMLLWVGMVIAFSSLIPHFLFNKCPHCGHQLRPWTQRNPYCPFCGKRVDGFLVSPNVEVTDSEVVSTGFAYSDHNPICMSVTLLAQ